MMLFEADGLGFLPRVGQPELATMPGMAASAPHLTVQTAEAPVPSSIPDTSISGPVTLQEPAAWNYDFNPASGSSRATYNGEVQFTSGGSGSAGVTSWNTRTGAVTLSLADVTGAGGAASANAALTGTPTAPTQGPTNSSTAIATTAFVRTGVTNGLAVPAGQIGEQMLQTGTNVTIAAGTVTGFVGLTLTAGDWLLWGNVFISVLTGANATAFSAGISQSNTGFTGASQTISLSAAELTVSNQMEAPVTRLNVAATTSVWLCAQVNSTATLIEVSGTIFAMRVR